MDSKPTKKEPRKPRKISKTYLENASLFYLQRYSSSANNLKRILTRKIKRSCTFHKEDPEKFFPLVDDLIERYISVGLLDDATFARGRVTSLRRQGLSKQGIIAKLQPKGLSIPQIEEALELVDTENGEENPEKSAAMAYTKRKKLGPHRRKPLTDPKDLQKELASLARAGFSYEIAKYALDKELD